MEKCKLFIICSFLFIASSLFAQDIKVEGRVTDKSTGEALIGAVVADATDKTKGTITDLDGKFTISVASKATLNVSLVGFEPATISVNGRKHIDIELADKSVDLGTVVVVGVSMKKSDLTGSVGKISGEKLAELPVTSANEAMQGRIAGVYIQKDATPGGGASIKIRGNNSIHYGTNPIYVVDGVVMDGGFNLVNPEDIASIDILKDASATSLYGSRGANGVVVITTKRGKKGGMITYDGWIGFSDYTKKMKLMNAAQLYDLRADAAANTYMSKNPGKDRQQYIKDITNPTNNEIFADYEHQSYRDGQSYNWLDEVTRSGFQQNHNISFSDADEKGSYYISLGYTKQEGLIKNSDYERFSGKVNIERSLKPWLTVGTSTSYVRGIYGLVEGSVYTNAMMANPLYPINEEDIYMKNYGSETLKTGTYNPLLSLTIKGDRKENRLVSANYMNINPIEGLNIRATISIDKMDKKEYWYIPKKVGQSMQTSYNGEASHRKDDWFNWQVDGSVSYETTFSKKHRLLSTVAVNISKNTWEYNQVNGRGFASDDFGYYYLNGATTKEKFLLASDFTSTGIAAFVQRVNYSYDNKYNATVTIREEGSSKFASNHRWGTFPSVALAWNASQEEFISNLNVFDQLKLRVGYGVVGNQNLPLYAIYSLYRPKVTNGNTVYNSDGRMGNPDLRWEKQKQLNVGLEIAVLRNRLSFSADYYNIINEDLLMERTLSKMTGYKTIIENVGELKNYGVEFSINGRIIENKDFTWNVSGNISFNKNKITKLSGKNDAIWNYGGATGVEIQRTGNLFLNESLNTIYCWKVDRIATQEDVDRIKNGQLDVGARVIEVGDILPVDTNGDKVINEDDKVIVGKTDPKFFGGFATDAGYKGFGLNLVFNYSYGGKRVSSLYENLMTGNGMTASHTDLLNRWTPENPNSNIPRAYRDGGPFRYNEVDLGIQNASYLRMAAITLSYNFSRTGLEKIGLKRVQIYFTGNNLLTFTKYKGYDPEMGDSYPATKMYVGGVRLSF